MWTTHFYRPLNCANYESLRFAAVASFINSDRTSRIYTLSFYCHRYTFDVHTQPDRASHLSSNIQIIVSAFASNALFVYLIWKHTAAAAAVKPMQIFIYYGHLCARAYINLYSPNIVRRIYIYIYKKPKTHMQYTESLYIQRKICHTITAIVNIKQCWLYGECMRIMSHK